MKQFNWEEVFYELCDDAPVEGLEVVAEQNQAEYDSYGDADYEIWYVVKLENNTLMKLRGRYQSHNGTEFEEAKEVKQQTKTIQVYE